MVQELHVLRCFSCETFQSHIVKKTNKWECKLCGVKQSIKKVYGRGSGKDCRIHTQKLNALKGQKEETESPNQLEKEINEPELCVRPMTINEPHSSAIPTKSFNRMSKWAEFIDENATAIGQDHFTKPENKVCTPNEAFEYKARKRKIRDDLANEDFGGYSEGFDSIDNTYSTFSNTCSGGYTNKIKSNKNCMSKNSYNSNSFSGRDDRDEHSTQGISRKAVHRAPFQINDKNHNHSQHSSKWAGYLKQEDELDSFKTASQNISHIKQKDTKISLKWSKYLEEEEVEVISAGKSSIKTSTNHQVGSEFCLKRLKYTGGPQEERVNGYFGIRSLNNFGRDLSDECRRESSNHLRKCTMDQFDSNSGIVSISEANLKSNRGSVNISGSFCINPSDSDTNSSFFDSSSLKQTGSPGLETLKENSLNRVQNSIEEVTLRQEEKFSSKIIPSLPVFEQNSDLCDSDFQLDF